MADAKQTAEQIAANPAIRARYLKDPYAAVEQAVPARPPLGLGILGPLRILSPGVDKETKQLREEVLAAVTEVTKDEPETASMRHAEAVMEQFFQAAIRNPERSFLSILGMSGLTFVVGLALVGVGVYVGLAGGDTTQDTVVASVFGGAGVFGALGSVYALARRGVSLANSNHAQIRLVLTGFATELGHLRALDLQEFGQVSEVNQKIREAMKAAVELIQTHVKVEPGFGNQELGRQPGAPPGENDLSPDR